MFGIRNGILALALVVAATGCSTFKVQRDRMASVKKIAIIGFSVEQERTNNLDLSWTSGGTGWKAEAKESKKGTLWETAQASHIINVYRSLSRQLERELGLRVADPERVIADPLYGEIAARERTQMRWVAANTQPLDFFSLPGVAGPEKADRFTREERQQLMRELGVDALAVAVVRLHFERFDNLVVGKFSAGSYTPSAQTTFTLYDGHDDEPIWKDFMVAGERLNSSVFQASGITNEELLYKKAVSASELSFHQLIQRYQAETSKSL